MKNNLSFSSKLKTMRFRYPRLNNVALKSYNEELTIVKAILLKLENKEHDFKDDVLFILNNLIYF